MPGVGLSAGQGMAQTSSCGQVPASSARTPKMRRSAKEATKRDLNVMMRMWKLLVMAKRFRNRMRIFLGGKPSLFNNPKGFVFGPTVRATYREKISWDEKEDHRN